MRKDYPRPELVRKDWVCLNGEWDFAFDFANTCEVKYLHFNPTNKITYNFPKEFSNKINVPFCPESKLSGIGYTDYIGACWYRKNLEFSVKEGKRILLHFEAAFHTTNVFLNGKFVGKHKGGYTPFTFDITDFLKDGKGELLVHCYGDSRDLTQPSGKQEQLNYPYGCFYKRSTGIWASVWAEIVEENYLKDVCIHPDCDNGIVNISLYLAGNMAKKVTLSASLNGKEVSRETLTAHCETNLLLSRLKIENFSYWDLDNPVLYALDITVKTETTEDNVRSYFGMRKLEVDQKGLKINGKRVFQRLVLDQGYYPDGLYTAPDEGCFAEDIALSKAMGFNGARLHQKVFERRFYYEADKQGYLVWAEYPSWGFDYTSESSLLHYLPEWSEAVERDRNHPCIIGWCPMNENWDLLGKRQNDDFMKQLYLETKRLDPTRPVIDVSWNYHVTTDYWDVHDYTQDLTEFAKRFARFEDGKVFDSCEHQGEYRGQPYFLSEYGGLKWPVEGEGWGYNTEGVTSEEDFVARLKGFVSVLYSNPRISAACYTQLYDVQQECNGLYYYDRKKKFSKKTIEKIAEAMKAPAAYESEE